MALTAKEMNSKYKETAEGGLAVSVTLVEAPCHWAGKTTNSLFSNPPRSHGWPHRSSISINMLRSAPSVMMPELGGAFGLTTAALAALVGLFLATAMRLSV